MERRPRDQTLATLDAIDALDIIDAIGTRLRLVHVQEQSRVCRALLGEGSAVPVAVLGRFKAGKSSFLNRLVGEELLPVGVTPVTAVITRLRWGTRAWARVSRLDGATREISLTELKAFISESENPKNIKQVSSVEIETPALSGLAGIELIDTPGLGSVFKHNTDVSLSWLPNVAAALVAVSVDPPLSEQDLALIEELLRFTPKVSLLLTKADLLSEPDLQEVLAFVAGQLRSRFGREFPVYPYSVREGFDSLRMGFKTAFLDPLISKRSEVMGEILRHKIRLALDQCEEFIRVGLAASERRLSEREGLKARILGEKADLSQTCEEIRLLASDLAGKTRSSYVSGLHSFQGPLLQKMTDDLGRRLLQSRKSLWRTTRTYEEWLIDSLGTEIAGISLSQRPLFLAPLTRAQSTLGRAVRAFQDRLGGSIWEILGVSFKGMDFKPEIREPSGPSISVGRAFDSHLDALSFMVPMPVFRRAIHRHLLAQLPYEVEKNFSRLASLWAERVNASIIDMGHQSERFISAQVQAFETVLSGNASAPNDLKQALEEVLIMKKGPSYERNASNR